jgi:pimeloyl-ACP methyl ester carboxylesterase
MGLKKNVILVVHDWGSALGFYWAQRYPERIRALVYLEAIVRPFFSWDEWPEATRQFFKRQRTSAGEELILQKNLFIEYLLPLRGISEEAMQVYRRYYRNPDPFTSTHAGMVEGIADRGTTRRCDQHRRFLCAVACGESDTEAFYQWRSGWFSDRGATRILPGMAESAGGRCKRSTFSARRFSC